MVKTGKPNLTLVTVVIAFVVVALGGIYLIISSSNSAQTTSTTTISTANTQVYGPADEISGVALVYPNTTLSTFSCNTNEDCVVVRTQHCFNNLASQQACIDKEHSSAYASYYESFLANASVACPQYFVLATASCSCINQGCSLIYAQK